MTAAAAGVERRVGAAARLVGTGTPGEPDDAKERRKRHVINQKRGSTPSNN
jgi:hypothetical protein